MDKGEKGIIGYGGVVSLLREAVVGSAPHFCLGFL